MKKIFKTISILLITTISMTLFIFKEKINIFAETMGMDDIRVGDVFKNGTIIPYNESFNICNLATDIDNCWMYDDSICFTYYDENDKHLGRETNQYYDSIYDYYTNSYKEVELKVSNDYSEYWIIDRIINGSGLSIVFKPYTYVEPTITITCDPNKVEPNEPSICTVKVKYTTKIRNIKFSLDTGEYEISNVTPGDFFEDLKLDDNMYSLNTKSLINDGEEVEVTVVTFKISSKEEKDIDVENNIKIQNITVTDSVGSKNTNELTATVKQESNKEIIPTKSDDEINEGKDLPKENPKTGNDSYLILYAILVVSVSISAFILVFQKSNVKL